RRHRPPRRVPPGDRRRASLRLPSALVGDDGVGVVDLVAVGLLGQERRRADQGSRTCSASWPAVLAFHRASGVTPSVWTCSGEHSRQLRSSAPTRSTPHPPSPLPTVNHTNVIQASVPEPAPR